MARSQKAVTAAAAMLLLSVLLPWVRWSAPWDLRNEASGSVSLADGQWVQFNTFVGEEIVSRTLLHPVYLPLLVGVGVALLGLALLRRWDRRSLAATTVLGAPVLAVTALSLRRATNDATLQLETPTSYVTTPDVAPGLGLLLAFFGAVLAVGAGVGGLAARAVPADTRARVRDGLRTRLGGRVAPQNAILGLAIGIALWYHVQFLGMALGRDAGAYLTVAVEILRGGLPYVHVFDHKPPGIYYYLAAVLGAGGSVHTAREGILLVNAGVAALLVLLGRRLWDATAGLVGALGYLVAAPLYGGYKIQTEQFVALFSLAALLVALRYRGAPRRERRHLALAGALAGLATLFKHPGVATLGALVLFVLAVPTGTEIRSAVRDRIEALAALCGGFALPIALVTAYFALLGGLGPFLRWVVLLNVGYLGSSTFLPAANLAAQYETMMTVWPVWVLAAGGLVLALGDWTAIGRPDPGQLLVVAAAVSALAIILVRPWPHYLLHPLPLAALLAGYAVYVIAADLPGDPRRAKTALVVGLVLSAGVAIPHLEEQRARNDGLARQQAIAADVASHLAPEDTLLVFPASPVYYYLVGVEPYGKNIYYLRSNRGVSYTQESIVETFRRRPPDYVLVRGWECDFLPTACSYLKSNYERVEGYDRSLTLYRANGTADG